MKRLGAALAVLALWLICSRGAQGFIDPSFTPVDLVQQSDVILLLEFADANAEGTAVGTVKEVVKGDYESGPVTVDFLAMGEALSASGKEAMGWIAGGRRQALLFVGSFTRDGGGGDERAGYLHLAGKWVVLSEFEGNWDMEKTDPRLLGCWAGSTDMLLRCVRYAMSNENATVPVKAGVLWQAGARLGQLEGTVFGMDAVDVTGTGAATDLFVAAAEGDRLYRFDGASLADETAKRGLTSKSQAYTWGELTGDGRLDLLSWDGRSLSLHAQRVDGTFEVRPLPGAEEALKGGCLSLAAIGAQGGTKVVASVAGPPLVLTIASDGSVTAKPLAAPDYPGKSLGAPGVCLVADFDADARPDLLQLFSDGSLFYRGKGEADFAEPVVSQVAAGEGRYGACIGDYDADGLPDVFVGGARRHFLFNNLSGGRFANLLDQSGEIEYIPKPGAIRVQTGDVNNDGRQDILIVYGAQMGPQLFFNRGFRSFGHARDLNIDVQQLLPEADEGQQAGCLGDFNGDGAPDMALALANGELWVFYRQVKQEYAMAFTVGVAPDSRYAGPVNVAAWAGSPSRALGTQVVVRGGPPVLWGVPESEAGDVTVKWTFPGGTEQTKVVEVVPGDPPKHVLLDRK